MEQQIKAFLARQYHLDATNIRRMTTGVGGDTFRVDAAQGSYVFKIVKSDDINHPELEASLCRALWEKGIPVSEFMPNVQGSLVTPWDAARLCHLQRYVDGKNFPMNAAPEWFMAESPLLLGRIHQTLSDLPRLPEGIGAGFFTHMTPERAIASYRRSLALAHQRSEEEIIPALHLRIKAAERISKWCIDPTRLTCCNTHGDYTVHQILCKGDRIQAVIDWTSACVHPVVWELTRSYFHATPECADGCYSEQRLADYAAVYQSITPLNDYDRAHLMDVYLYQLAVCDYYAQYLHAPAHERTEFRQQADFATRVLERALL